MLSVMDFIMTGQTRHLVGPQLFSHFLMRRGFFKFSSTGVTVQTFAIFVRFIESELCRNCLEIIDVKMPQPTKLGLGTAKHGVVRVTCITRSIFWDPVVLEMGSGKIRCIVDPETFP